MGNIFADIAEEIEIKPSKSKLVLKWVVRAATILIAGAFTYGQIKMTKTAKINNLETSIIMLKDSQERGFIEVNTKLDNMDNNFNARIDKVYEDAQHEYTNYQEFNRKQLELIIDFGSENKDMLKRMLEINSMENTRKLEASLNQAKNEDDFQITPVNEVEKEYLNMVHLIELESGDTLFGVKGATQKFIDEVKNNNNYTIEKLEPSERYVGRFNVDYKNR